MVRQYPQTQLLRYARRYKGNLRVDFATVDIQGKWASYLQKEQLNVHYKRSRPCDMARGLGNVMATLRGRTYHGLKNIRIDPATRPDIPVADFFVNAPKNARMEYKVPISRISNGPVVLRALPEVPKPRTWTKAMRKSSGPNYLLLTPKEPDYLLLVNSFFDHFETEDLPPLVAAKFPDRHQKTISIASGTHTILHHAVSREVIQGLVHITEEGVVDGLIWSVGESGRNDAPKHVTIQEQTISLEELFDGEHADWILPSFAPQRSILDPSLYPHNLTHGGGISTNKGLCQGKPMLEIPFYFDHIGNAADLAGSGTSEVLHMFHFTTDKLLRRVLGADLIGKVLYDTEARVVDGREIRPIHLQTSIMPMLACKEL
ncbi:uncharacterized protein BO87DRAFT_403153 [Aspergillus neoniger CBS 115656]|uniref:Uncharacterized protein n=1 Tax=Aspergillus neoniger (strain CBS 115656) TaxID=1448310 RepID=A0A318YX78_ASPNB|nr:hypothetical protein BO87DRAFT_403153 [Aspergillus neoniger CBS 115656]PYH39216.1 hypothetical protein BO87DRAFT_403153 [Aspergillus neoniger CBS 115656]